MMPARQLESRFCKNSFRNSLFRFYRENLVKNQALVKERGLRVLLWHKGSAAFFIFLVWAGIRNTILYIGLPFLLARLLFLLHAGTF